MCKNLRLAAGEYERQFVREALAVMNENGAVWFLVFPVVGEFDGTPVGNVALFAFSEHSVEHSGCTKETDMASMKRCKRSAAYAALFAKEYPTGLTVGG